MNQDDAAPLTQVRLTRKFAEAIDGVDLSRNQVGDQLRVSHHDARMLIAEGWASPCDESRADEEPRSDASEAIIGADEPSRA